MVLDNDQIKRRDGHLAPVYDAVLLPLGLNRHRKEAITLLHLRRGDTVLGIGCGTGLNFPILHEAVGPEGRIIGVDLSSAMLAKAQERLVRARFSNVDLIQADMASYDIPLGIAGAVATYTLEMIPAYNAVIRRIAAVLPIGGRLASHGLKHPERWPDWLVHMGIWITKPFGVSRAYESFRPWVSIQPPPSRGRTS